MVFVILFVGLAIVGAAWLLLRCDKLAHIPGPPQHWLYGNTREVDSTNPHLFDNWHNQYGNIIRVSLTFGHIVVVGDFDNIYKVLVTDGQAFAGRSDFFREEYILGKGGIFLRQPDKVWKAIRKLVHGHVKQFGGGLPKLEDTVAKASDTMFASFEQHKGKAMDPHEAITEATIAVLFQFVVSPAILRTHPLYDRLIKASPMVMAAASPTTPGYRIVDLCPYAIHLPFLPQVRQMMDAKAEVTNLWNDIKCAQTDEHDSLASVFLKHITAPTDMSLPTISEADITTAIIELLIAGQVTTVPTFYAIIHVLGNVPGIQEAAFREVDQFKDKLDEGMLLKYKQEMPYIQALVYETLRCFTAVPHGFPHETIEDTSLPGCGIIPKGTKVFTNLWRLHHDESFWEEPDVFRPERFLDDDGQLLPASDPKRKHLMPFGAGPRVCVAEVFAICRLFIWTAGLVQRFRIHPAPEKSNINWMDPSVHPVIGNATVPLPYKIIFEPREDTSN